MFHPTDFGGFLVCCYKAIQQLNGVEKIYVAISLMPNDNLTGLMISECQDVNNAWLDFKTCFLHVADNHAPQIEKKVRGRNTPWLSNKIKKVMAEKDQFLPSSSQDKHRITLVQIQEFEKSGYCYDSKSEIQLQPQNHRRKFW